MTFNWRNTPQATAAKASRTFRNIRRNFRDCRKQIHATTCMSMGRPTMEYASTSWDQDKGEDIICLGKVQRRVQRYVWNNCTGRTQGRVTAMVSSLGWENTSIPR